jgi:hypothetical protein
MKRDLNFSRSELLADLVALGLRTKPRFTTNTAPAFMFCFAKPAAVAHAFALFRLSREIGQIHLAAIHVETGSGASISPPVAREDVVEIVHRGAGPARV